jgi:protein-disulfide isomerase
MIDAKLVEREAERRGVKPEEVLALEGRDRGAVSDEEVAAFWREHQATMGGLPLEKLAPQIRRYLERQRERELPGRLRERAGVVVHLAMPRVEIPADGPARGPADARVTIVEFADFECPYCKRAVATLDAILARYPDDVRLVYRHLPIEKLHAQARTAAEAAACAGELGAFWPYHDKLFRMSPALERSELVGYAAELGLDAANFGACVDERRHRGKVDADLALARAIGADGTPTFVVNGVVLSGAQSEQDFDRLIEAELARAPAR